MKQNYLLESDEVAQICASLQGSIKIYSKHKSLLKEARKNRIWSDEEVSMYNLCTEEIEKIQLLYNKFRS